jgi:hypothetical protein
MSRVIVAPTQTLLNKIQESFKTRQEYPNGWWKESSEGVVDMSQLGTFDIIAVDAQGDFIYDETPIPFLAPNDEPCYYANQDPVLVANKALTYAETNRKCISFDKLKQAYNAATEKTPHNIVSYIETGIWVGLISDTDNHTRIVSSKRIRQN